MHEREELVRLNAVIRQTLSEKCHEVEYLNKKFEGDSQALVVRKDQLIRECK